MTIAKRISGFTRPDEDDIGRIVEGLFPPALTINRVRRTSLGVNAHSYPDARSKHTPDQRDHDVVRKVLRAGPPDVDHAYSQIRWLLPWLDARSRRLLRSDPTLSHALWLLFVAQGIGHETRSVVSRRRGKRWLGIGVFLSAMLSLSLLLAITIQATRHIPGKTFGVAAEMPLPLANPNLPTGDDAADP